MRRRCVSNASVVSLLFLVGALTTGCKHETGPSPDSQVQGLQLTSELERTKKKLEVTQKEMSAKEDAVVLAKAETDKAKKDVADREKVIADKDAKIRALEGELAEVKKRDAFVYADASRLHQQNLNTSSLERYRQFVASYPTSPLVADANRAIAELSVTAPKEARARAVTIDPYAVERDALKRYNEGWATPEDLAPLLKGKSKAVVVKLLGSPNMVYREGAELGYVDKVVDANTGNRGTLVIGFEEDKVATLRLGYLGKPIRP